MPCFRISAAGIRDAEYYWVEAVNELEARRLVARNGLGRTTRQD